MFMSEINFLFTDNKLSRQITDGINVTTSHVREAGQPGVLRGLHFLISN